MKAKVSVLINYRHSSESVSSPSRHQQFFLGFFLAGFLCWIFCLSFFDCSFLLYSSSSSSSSLLNSHCLPPLPLPLLTLVFLFLLVLLFVLSLLIFAAYSLSDSSWYSLASLSSFPPSFTPSFFLSLFVSLLMSLLLSLLFSLLLSLFSLSFFPSRSLPVSLSAHVLVAPMHAFSSCTSLYASRSLCFRSVALSA